MNEFIEYICRGIIHSEDAVKRLNKNVAGLAKNIRFTNSRVTCVVIASLAITAVVAIQDKEIKALQQRVADLEDKNETHDTTEEQNDQEGA